MITDLWEFLGRNAQELGALAAIAALAGAVWAVYAHYSRKPKREGTRQQITRGDENIQVGEIGGDVIITKGANGDLGKALLDKLEIALRREGAQDVRLEDSAQREVGLRDQVRQLTEAVNALSSERDKPDAPPGIDEALSLLAEGKTEAAESVFREVKDRRKAEGAGAFKEAAAAARHIGALAFLHDTDKALSAYREAVDLDPDNADGWNQLGYLLHRTSDLEGAEHAYGRVLSLGNRVDDKELIAIATGNLGILYQTRGDLDRAEEMYRKSLEIDEALGRKEGMAIQYGNLGTLYFTRVELDRADQMYRKALEIDEALGRKEGMASQYGNLGNLYATRGDLDRAEQMHLKSLEIEEALGRKEGMASQYGNLGIVYETRGDLDRAEEMYRKTLEINEALGHKEGMASTYGNLGNLYSTRGDLTRAEEMYEKALALFRELGAAPMVEKTEALLAELRNERR